MPNFSELYDALLSDQRREELGWGADFSEAQNALLAAPDDRQRGEVLGEWLAHSQPCLFGKIAAREKLIEYCFITGSDLTSSDVEIRDKIQASRLQWRREGYHGRKHAFVVHVLDTRVAQAAPDGQLLAFAKRLGELYLLESDLQVDHVYLDQLFLRIPGLSNDHLLRWAAGVNVFAAAADRRWWQDHRIPGGIAFSVNSVGHMAKSAQVRGGMVEMLERLGLKHEIGDIGKVEDLEDALKLAMRTIAGASKAVSGPATWLIPASETVEDCPPCPVALGKQLDDKSPCSYRGVYHTDFTLPSSYFQEAVERPAGISALKLDFTYLFHNTVENPDYTTMGGGEQIRGNEAQRVSALPTRKVARQWPTEVSVADFPELKALLE